MTRDEAIKWLKDERNTWREDFDSNHIAVKAIDLAISALKWQDKMIKDIENFILYGNNITESPNDVVETDDEVVDHDREWIIGCIKHDGFIKTDRFDKANQIILDALEVQKCHINTDAPSATNHEKVQNCGDNSLEKVDCDLISREKAIESAEVHCATDGAYGYMDIKSIVKMLESLPSVSADIQTEDYSDLPDIPRAYYEKIVGNMSHEINMLKQQLEDILSVSAEPTDEVYIKIYSDDEPSVKAEKLYQICDEEQKTELTERLKDYFPSAEPKRGKWVRRDNYKVMGEGFLWHCSICDQSVYQDSSRDYPSEHYCPNCGAIMTPPAHVVQRKLWSR